MELSTETLGQVLGTNRMPRRWAAMMRFSGIHGALGFITGLGLGFLVGGLAFNGIPAAGIFALAVGAVAGVSSGYYGGEPKHHRRHDPAATGLEPDYDLESFAARYDLSHEKAARLLTIYGPSMRVLDAYMASQSSLERAAQRRSPSVDREANGTPNANPEENREPP